MAFGIQEQLVALVCFAVLYCAGLAVYRLYLSPIAKFPGPKIAAVSLWYEYYYDVKKRGQYTWKIGEMHKQFGPIVRINPYYDELYITASRRTTKYEWAMKAFGPTTSTFQTQSHELHRTRRSALAPLFSKASVTQLEPLVQANIEKLAMQFSKARDTGAIVNIPHACIALTNDIICEYAFASPQGFIDNPEAAREWATCSEDILETSLFFKQFPWVFVMLRKFPPDFAKMMNPKLSAMLKIAHVCREKIAAVKADMADGKDFSGQRNIFYELINNKQLSPMDKSDARLEGEGKSVMAAGSNTTAHTLSIMIYHLIKQEKMRGVLHSELKAAQAKQAAPLKWAQLEQLPYLSAIVTEALRWSCGVTSRLARISPDVALQYKEWTIPAGTPVGMSTPLVQWNPEIFPDPRAFKPERWLQPDSARLRKYLVAFSKGSRQCLAMNLAYAELYLTIAALFTPGRFKFELFETNDSDVEIVHDFFAPFPRVESKGIRVMVT